MRWHGIATPTEAHIHVGAAGADGDVAIPLFGAGLPDTAIAVTGSVTVSNTALLNQIEGNPAGFYANIHTAEFPGGAVRGQLHYGPSVDPGHMLYVGGITSTDTGRQELPNPNGEATDDPDGQGRSCART